MLLEEIIDGSTKSEHIFIIDTADERGSKISNAVLRRYKSKPLPVHVLCFEQSCDYYTDKLGTTVICHDMFSNSSISDICGHLSSKVERGTKINLWIDSLTSALINFEVNQLYQQIHRLLRRQEQHGFEIAQLLSTVHKDVTSKEVVELFSHLASTVIEVNPPLDKQPYPLYNLTHTKPNGKIFKETQLYSIAEGGKVQSHPLKVDFTPVAPSNSVSKPVHDKFSTFRHGVSVDEQRARDRLILPYQQLSIGGNARGQGRIEYEPEEADEWDEEDPDDDLEV